MIFISAQPWDTYFHWQVEVQIVNFRKFNISDKMNVLIWYPKGADYSFWLPLVDKYPEVSFSFYEDEGVNLGLYIPQLRPHILARHFDKNPSLKDEVIFYHDSDIIFNYLPDFNLLSEGDVNWQSDTSGYLDYNYLRRKEIEGKIPEDEAIKVLCNIGNVTVETMKSYSDKTGGAQCILKGVDGDYWRDVEKQVITIRQAFTHKNAPNVAKTPENMAILSNSINTKYFPTENAGFQSWCADMWAVNMALWSRNKVTDVIPLLDFSWATDSKETYLKKPIFHNAGVTRQSEGLFYKGGWMSQSPIGKVHRVKKDSASYFYVQAINEVK